MLVTLVSLLIAVVGFVWYRNGQTFVGLVDNVEAFARGYGRAPNTVGSEETEMETSSATSVMMASALLDKQEHNSF